MEDQPNISHGMITRAQETTFDHQSFFIVETILKKH